jgi:NAD(P)-dependent dehydrogenase (short-subunit alcohol dehydrogenase family)
MGRVAGKVALVTGGASGLGRATAIMLAKEGAKVAVTDINEAGGRAVAAGIGDAAVFLHHDVTSEGAWQSVLAAVVDAFGKLNILVNSAGIGMSKTVEELTFEEWRRVHSIDLDSVFLGCKYAVPLIARSGGGSIVNISSIAGIIAGHNMAAYNSAKAGVRLLSKSVALHCARQGYNIRCNSVHPTFIDTPILDRHKARFGAAEAIAKMARQVPLGRIGEPDDVACGILYLASDESKFVTGTELVVDGGISAM